MLLRPPALRHTKHFPHVGGRRGDLRRMRDGKADLALVDDLGGGSHGIYGLACQNREGKQYPEVHNPSPPCTHPASLLPAKRSNPGRPCTTPALPGPFAPPLTNW